MFDFYDDSHPTDIGKIKTAAKILDLALHESETLEQIKIIEDIHQMNVQEAFDAYNEAMLGLPGMRLDLFFPDDAAIPIAIEDACKKEKMSDRDKDDEGMSEGNGIQS